LRRIRASVPEHGKQELTGVRGSYFGCPTSYNRKKPSFQMPIKSHPGFRKAGVVPVCMAEVPDKRSDEQLRLLTTVVEHSTESVLITNAQLELPGPQIVYVNPAFTRMTGYMPEEVIGKTPRILQGPKTERSVLDRLRRDCAAGKVFHGETINYRKDGSEVYLKWTIAPVWNDRGEITHFIATQRDLTERLQVEERLRKREEEFRSLFELSAVGMTQVSPEGQYLRVNRKLCNMLGYSEQEL